MAKHYISARARCPYYKHEDSQLVYCLGLDDSTTTHVAFSSATRAREYKETYCYKDCRKCPLNNALSQVYGE